MFGGYENKSYRLQRSKKEFTFCFIGLFMQVGLVM